jgi:amino acid permease
MLIPETGTTYAYVQCGAAGFGSVLLQFSATTLLYSSQHIQIDFTLNLSVYASLISFSSVCTDLFSSCLVHFRVEPHSVSTVLFIFFFGIHFEVEMNLLQLPCAANIMLPFN